MAVERVIIALDNMKLEEVHHFLLRLQSIDSAQMPMIKVGLEMFLRYGHQIVHDLYDKYKTEIFLDLKLHDIPNTVYKAIRSLEGLPIKFLTIHLSGGRKMIEKAIQAQKEVLPYTDLLGVSYLTSLGIEDFKEVWNTEESEISKAFERLIQLALDTNLSGVVSSVNEVELIKSLESQSKKALIKVTPGIRFEDEIQSGQLGDQKRVASPEMAFKNGSNYLVIGRSLTQSPSLDKRMDQLRQL